MLEYDYQFESSQDGYDRLDAKYEKLRIDYELLKKEYIILYNALMGHLDEAKKRKLYHIDRNPKELNDIKMTEDSIKQARVRTLGKEEV